MAAEIALRQLLTIAHQLEEEGCKLDELPGCSELTSLNDIFARIDWQQYADIMTTAANRWGLVRLAEIGAKSLHIPEAVDFRDAVMLQHDDLNGLMAGMCGPRGMFTAIVPCMKAECTRLSRRRWLISSRMLPGYELSEAHCHYSLGAIRALPVLLFESPAKVELTLEHDRVRYAITAGRPRLLSAIRRRHARSVPNPQLAERIGSTFNELMVRQTRLQSEIERRAEAEARLAHAEKLDALGRLTGGIAHDFNNLLAVAQGQLELLRLDLSDAGLKTRIDEARRALMRGAELTQQLLAFGSRAALKPVPTNANEVIEQIESMLTRVLGEVISIHAELTEPVWTTMVDRGQLENALLNLAINARDAMHGGGTLKITTANVHLDASHGVDVETGDYVAITMSDTGSGMTQEMTERAFDPFYTTKAIGSGLGLSMVWGFLKQSGGSARISSELGKGTTITLYLPGSPGNTTRDATQPPDDDSLPMTKRYRILLVENEPAVRSVVADMLDRLGHEVVEAGDGPDAVELLETEPVDLLLTDIVLPGGMAGTAIATHARNAAPTLPVLYMSGYSEAVSGNSDALRDDEELLAKPFSIAELSRALESNLSPLQPG